MTLRPPTLERPSHAETPASPEVLFREARRRRHRRYAVTVAIVASAVVAALAGYDASGGGTRVRASKHRAKHPVTARPVLTGSWKVPSDAIWQHGTSNGQFVGTTLTCVAGSPSCYVVVEADGIAPDGSPTTPGVVPGFSVLHSSAYRSLDGGLQWDAIPIPSKIWLTTSFSCWGGSTCAVGAVVDPGPSDTAGTAVLLTTANDGATWARQPFPSTVALVSGLACSSASHCVAIVTAAHDDLIDGVPPLRGDDTFRPKRIETTSDGGAQWNPASLGPLASGVSVALSSVKCTTAKICLATGVEADIVVNDGTYVPENSTADVFFSSDGGRSFTTSYEVTESSLWGLYGPACDGGGYCMMLAQSHSAAFAVLTSTDGGRTWSAPEPSELSDNWTGAALSCPAAGDCVVRGTGIVSTNDGGKRWVASTTLPTPPPGYSRARITEISCGARTCVALDIMTPPSSSHYGTRVLVMSDRSGGSK